MKCTKCVIIFSGFNQRAVISFIRTLEKNKLNYAIIAMSTDDDIFLTEYRHKVLAVRNNRNLVLSDLLERIETVQDKVQAEKYIIAPSTEALNRYLLEEKKAFEESSCHVPLVDKEIYETVSDKYSFGELCRKHGINIPKELNTLEQIEFPIVAKPKEYFSSSDRKILAPIIIENNIELNKFNEMYNDEDFYFQEYVNGRSLYLLYYFHSNGNTYKYSQENLMQQPGGKSMLVARPSDFHKSKESQKYEALFKDINYFGLVMIEVKQFKDNNYMIEANPRFWGPSQLFVDAGINFFEFFLHDLEMIEDLPKLHTFDDKVKYCWLGGLGKNFKDIDNVTFYNYSKEKFYNDFWELLNNDIYSRSDTQNIFTKEFFKLKGADFNED